MLRQMWLYLLLPQLFPLFAALSTLSNYSAPARPAGFSTQISYTTTLINRFSAYMAAIKAVAKWSDFAWDSLIEDTKIVRSEVFGLRISCWAILPPGSRAPLKLSHVLLGLNDGILHMAEHLERHEFAVGLYLNGQPIGFVTVRKDGAAAVAGQRSDVPQLSDSNFWTFGQLRNNTMFNARSGRVPDPTQPKLALIYQYQGGSQFLATEVLTTILDAMVNMASENSVMQHQQIYGYSHSKLYELSIESRQPLWTKWSVEKGLLLLAWLYNKQRRWEAMDFSLTWQGKEFAAGYLWERIELRRSGAIGVATSEKQHSTG
ncbi:MAG: hypothetical protein Q9213_000521 [Squamulea squamosa]